MSGSHAVLIQDILVGVCGFVGLVSLVVSVRTLFLAETTPTPLLPLRNPGHYALQVGELTFGCFTLQMQDPETTLQFLVHITPEYRDGPFTLSGITHYRVNDRGDLIDYALDVQLDQHRIQGNTTPHASLPPSYTIFPQLPGIAQNSSKTLLLYRGRNPYYHLLAKSFSLILQNSHVRIAPLQDNESCTPTHAMGTLGIQDMLVTRLESYFKEHGAT